MNPEPPETPRFEPEIIPPSRGPVREDNASRGAFVWRGVRVVRLERVGPLRLALWAIVATLFIATIFALLAGALLIAIPVAAGVILVSVVAARLRGWLGR